MNIHYNVTSESILFYTIFYKSKVRSIGDSSPETDPLRSEINTDSVMLFIFFITISSKN